MTSTTMPVLCADRLQTGCRQAADRLHLHVYLFQNTEDISEKWRCIYDTWTGATAY